MPQLLHSHAESQPLSAHVDVRRAVPRLHVELAGARAKRPVVVLLHGTGSCSKGWRQVLRLLAPHCSVVALDLPGHGRSADPGRGHYSPAAMAHAVARELTELRLQPDLLVGHSAGAAVAVQGLLTGLLSAKGLVAVNPALLPFPGLQGVVFSGSAKLLARLPFVSDLIAGRARDPRAVDRLLRDVGSELPEAELQAYQRRFSNPAHIQAVLSMMAEWNLQDVAGRLPALTLPVLLLGGSRDKAVPVGHVRDLSKRLPNARCELFAEGGHLLHEEQPRRITARLLRWWRAVERLPQ